MLFLDADFFEADFLDADFLDAAFFGADFFDDDFFEADFFGADFFEADFFETDFLDAAFFGADFFEADFFDDLEADFFLGTLAPSSRASESPMATACLCEVTFLPVPVFNLPSCISCMAFSTFLPAFFEYFAMIWFFEQRLKILYPVNIFQ